MGLFILRNRGIVHFTYEISDTGDGTLKVELFGEDGQLEKAGPVHGYIEEPAFGTEVRWKDIRDQFYLLDQRGDFPVLRVVRLKE